MLLVRVHCDFAPEYGLRLFFCSILHYWKPWKRHTIGQQRYKCHYLGERSRRWYFWVRPRDDEDERRWLISNRKKWSVCWLNNIYIYFLISSIPLVLSDPGAINIVLEDVPPGDDYFLLFINSTIGQMYAISSTFSVLAADATPSVTSPSPAGSVPTVTVSGTPVPTPLFATTFATLPGGAVALFSSAQVNALLLTLLGCAFGASLTLGWWFSALPRLWLRRSTKLKDIFDILQGLDQVKLPTVIYS